MAFEIKIPDDTATHLNALAVGEFRAAIEQYAGDLFREAGRLEATAKSTKGVPEVTSTMVKDADILLRRGYARQPKKPLLVLSQLVATVGGFVTGLLADMDKLKDATTLVVFVILLTLTITATVIAVIKD